MSSLSYSIITLCKNLCPCGKPFDVDHAMSCFKGGFIHQRHDQMRDMIAQLMSDIYKD